MLAVFMKAHVKGYSKKDGTVVKDHERQDSLFVIKKDAKDGQIKKMPHQGSLFGGAHHTSQKIVAPQYGMGNSPPLWASSAKPKAYHPETNDKGHAVGILDPHEATGADTWADPSAVAVFTPGGNVPTTLNGVALSPWVDHPTTADDWDFVEGQKEDLDEPPLSAPTGKHIAAGVVVQEPDGRVWIVSPTNGYGGYTDTFPKGTVEDFMSFQASAIKEAFEESGLKVEITGFIGDFMGTTSVTRYYTARRVGGSPAAMGWESQAVSLVPAEKLAHLLESARDRKIVKQAL